MITVIKLGIPLCGPCTTMDPIIEKLQQKYHVEGSNVSLEKVNVLENSEYSIKYNVKTVPTTIFLKDNKVKYKEIGALTEARIEELIAKLKR